MHRHHKPQKVCRPLNPILHANNTLFQTKMAKKPLSFEVTHTYVGEYIRICTSRAHVSCVIRWDHVLLQCSLSLTLATSSWCAVTKPTVRYQKTEPRTFLTSRGKFCPSKIMISPYKEFCFSQYPKGMNKRGIRVISMSVHNQIRGRTLPGYDFTTRLAKQSVVTVPNCHLHVKN